MITLTDVKYERNYELLPAVTFSQNNVQREGSWQRDSRKLDFSLTGKLGITSDLTLDAAYNPDFSQVESDAGQIDINLRSSLYYSEKRPFFLEGKENFDMAAPMEQDPLYTVVYTRTIVDPLLGFKLTGKVGRRDMVSSIFALDEFPGAAGRRGGRRGAGRPQRRLRRFPLQALAAEGQLPGRLLSPAASSPAASTASWGPTAASA